MLFSKIMFILIYIINGLATVSDFGLTILYWLILIRVLISWVSPDPYNPIVQFLTRTTDPVLEPIRRMMMPLTSRILIDFSPLIAFFIIVFLRRNLVAILYQLSYTLKTTN